MGHIAGSVLLGMIGVALGITITKIEGVESFRGNLAAWFLIAFGLVYFVWGLRSAVRSRMHKHLHAHKDGLIHIHKHIHTKEHVHIHEKEGILNLTPWILFIIFVLGPCEPLIPILMYPAAKESLLGLVLVISVFGGVTIITMLSVVFVSTFGINLLHMGRVEKYTHALAGVIICICGLAIQFLGL